MLFPGLDLYFAVRRSILVLFCSNVQYFSAEPPDLQFVRKESFD